MTQRSTLVFGIAAVFAVLRIDAGGVRAQTPQAPPRDVRFEVASVKPMLSVADYRRQAAAGVPMPRAGITTMPGGRFTASMETLKQLIVYAFDVREFQVE